MLNLNNAAVSPPPLVVEQAIIEAYRLADSMHRVARCMLSLIACMEL
ncbi:hypothetical protein [Cupriavidus sp. IDO]|nr:hypothetical protein [Cupriavidus sp. IDO]